jgi:selenocysteine lyase/cysteine desulfurase
VVSADALRQAIGPRTRAVVVSWVRYDTGSRADLAALGAICAARGIWLIVDAIQGLGLFPLDVHATGITALAAGTHKWLCGLAGLGLLYVESAMVERLRPVRTGLGAVRDERHGDLPTPETFELRSDLARIEDGAPNELAIAALGASLTVLASVSDAVEHVRQLTEHLAEGWRSIGGAVASPRDGEQWSGIVSLEPPPSRSLDDVLGRAWAAKITVGPIRGRLVPSAHVYTSRADIDAFLAAVR